MWQNTAWTEHCCYSFLEMRCLVCYHIFTCPRTQIICGVIYQQLQIQLASIWEIDSYLLWTNNGSAILNWIIMHAFALKSSKTYIWGCPSESNSKNFSMIKSMINQPNSGHPMDDSNLSCDDRFHFDLINSLQPPLSLANICQFLQPIFNFFTSSFRVFKSQSRPSLVMLYFLPLRV